MSGKVNLRRWSPHLAAARREGKTLTQYARSRGLSRHTLYAARQMLRRVQGESGVQSRLPVARRSKPPAPAAFAAVKLAMPLPAVSRAAPRRLRAQLANGVRLEFSWEGSEAELLAAAIHALAGQR